MKVENLNGYANQFLVYDLEDTVEERITFISYKSEICNYTYNILQLNSDMWDYSATTRRHFKAFINEYTPFTYENKQQWLKEIESNDLIEVV